MNRDFPIPSTRMFGAYKIEFFQGRKNKNDYIIKVNNNQVTDKYIFEGLHKYSMDISQAKDLLIKIWELSSEEDENVVYSKINNIGYNDKLKVVLFCLWHRLKIDDVTYPISKGYNGRKRALGQTYILIAKKFGLKLPACVIPLPEEIFKLGFPDVLYEKISKDQWNEIYTFYKDFYEKM